MEVSEMLENSIDSIRRLIDVDTIIGDEINIYGYTIIPVSNVKLSFATLGADIITKKENKPSTGGLGGMVNVNPVCFIAIKDDDIKILSTKLNLEGIINNITNKVS